MGRDQIKILLAEDDANLGFVIRDNLEQHGFLVELCKDGMEALESFETGEFHICILDVMMPKMDGFTLAEKIRSKNSQVPILFLTARTMKEDRLKGFLLGGDDYITKPFSIEELIMRIHVFVKRSQVEHHGHEKVIQLGKYDFEYDNLLLSLGDQQKQLTQMEADILRYMCDHKGKIVRRSEILESIWGDDDYFSGRSLDVFISRLRKYLNKDKHITITNHHGVGFKLTY
jgi:DNA-binding response OmpR family regulator